MNTEPIQKQLSFDQAPAVMRRLRAEGKRIVQCHGTFDLLHPGHMIHFEEARALGDVLVVTVTGEKYVNKGPGRPYFNDHLRVKSLAAVQFVDYVIVVPHPAAVEAIECVQPHVYCKGTEYRVPETDVTGNIHDDLSTVARLGGEVRYVGSVVFSSTRLLNRHFDTYSPRVSEFCREVAREYPAAAVRSVAEEFGQMRVLVVGDVIFDRYTTVSVQGLTSKNRIISCRYMEDDLQAGGSLAVLRHIREFAPHVRLLGLVGTEPWVDETLARYVTDDEDEIVRWPGFTTVVKQRFVEPLSEGKEISKLFAVNYLDAHHPGDEVHQVVRDLLAEQIESYDLVIAMDFGHGFFGDSLRELVQEKARFLAVNCQTNSNNHGFNIINRRYRRADAFSLDQAEICLACGKRDIDYPAELNRLHESLDAEYGWLTRGAVETIGVRKGEPPCICPPFEMKAVDPVGAGDAFTSVASLAAARRLPIRLATFMGQLAGAQAVRIVGNSDPIRKDCFLKGCEAMLNY
jgi:cytidyltransferase-like protein